MVAVGIYNAFRLLEQILINLLTLAKLYAVIGPRRTLGLQIHAHLIGCSESGLGRTVAVKAHVVKSILLALAKYAEPLVLGSRRKAGFRETAVLYGSAQIELTAVDKHLRPLNLNLAKAEAYGNIGAAILHGAGVETGIELVPQLNIAAQCKMIGLLVYSDIYSLISKIRHYPFAIDNGRGLKLYATRYAVPVALSLVGNRVRILTNTHVLDAIINTDFNQVFFASLQVIGKFVLMWHRKTHLVPHHATINKNGGLDVWSLKE